MNKKFTHKKGKCELCGRTACLEEHHLKPLEKKIKNNLKRREKAWVCVDCARQIHAFFTNHELTKKYYNIELLKQHPLVKKYLLWVRKKKILGLHPSMKN
jgi:5-methylcytosine-specific restriction protein A